VAAKSKPQKAKVKAAENIHPHFDAMLPRADKEKRLGQRGVVCWLYGLSGSGKSTLTLGLERQLFAEGKLVQVLDGDNIRSGLNRDLGFGDLARRENIRRVAEVAKLFAQSGFIVLASFITPRENFRALAREPQILRPDLVVDTEALDYPASLKLIHATLVKKIRTKK